MIKAAPTFIRKLDRAVDVDEGEPLELKCVVEGSPLPAVTWLKDGQLIEPSDRYIDCEFSVCHPYIYKKNGFDDRITTEMSLNQFRIQLVNTPDGAVKLTIAHAIPSDCGAYKLVLQNPHGETASLCAVAVKRKKANFPISAEWV